MRQYGYLTEALGTAGTFFSANESYSLSGFERWLKDMLGDPIPRLAQQIIAWLPDMLGSRPMSASQKRDFVRTVADDFVADLHRVGELLFPRQNSKDAVEQEKQFGPSSEELMLLEPSV